MTKTYIFFLTNEPKMNEIGLTMTPQQPNTFGKLLLGHPI